MQRQPARRREGARAFIDEAAVDQRVGDEPAQILRRLALHARGDFLGEEFEKEIGHSFASQPRVRAVAQRRLRGRLAGAEEDPSCPSVAVSCIGAKGPPWREPSQNGLALRQPAGAPPVILPAFTSTGMGAVPPTAGLVMFVRSLVLAGSDRSRGPAVARLQVGRAAGLGELAHAQDVALTLGDGDHPARVEQVEDMARLDALVVGRQREPVRLSFASPAGSPAAR